MSSKKSLFIVALGSIVAITGCLWLSCEMRKVMDGGKILSSEEADSIITLRGRVIDIKTGAGIQNATVTVTGDTTVTTDADGFYKVRHISAGSYHVISSKAGYSSSFTTATVDSISAAVYAMYLMPLSTPVTVGAAGGTVSAKDPDSNVTSLIIPPGALSGTTDITVTPLVGLEMPKLPLANRMAIAVVNLGPQNIALQDSATLSIQLPIKLPAGDTMHLFSYNTQNDNWQETEVLGTVGEDSVTLTAKVGELEIYAVMPEMQTTKTVNSSDTSVSNKYLSCEDTFYLDTVQNNFTMSDTGNLPKTFCKSLLEQAQGISFSHPIIYCGTYHCSGNQALQLAKTQKVANHLRIKEMLCLDYVEEFIDQWVEIDVWENGEYIGKRWCHVCMFILKEVYVPCHNQGGGYPL